MQSAYESVVMDLSQYPHHALGMQKVATAPDDAYHFTVSTVPDGEFTSTQTTCLYSKPIQLGLGSI
jgi:hypothetical protein